MKKIITILLSLLLMTACTATTEIITKQKDRVIGVNYLIEVQYLNGDIDTLKVEYFTLEFQQSGLNLSQKNGVSYISCENCKDEYLRDVKAIAANVRKYKIIDRNVYALN